MAKESKPRALSTENHLRASPHSQNRLQSHPFSPRKTSTNFSISKKWVCSLPLSRKLCSNWGKWPLLAAKQPESRFWIRCRSRNLTTLLKTMLISSFLSIMSPTANKTKNAGKANTSLVTSKTTQALKMKGFSKALTPRTNKASQEINNSEKSKWSNWVSMNIFLSIRSNLICLGY